MKLITLLPLLALNCGAANYYVDYNLGSDLNSGTNIQSAWKHLPQDGNATGIPALIVLKSNDVVALKGKVIYTPAYPHYEPTSPWVTFTTYGNGKAFISGRQPNGTTNTYGFKLSGNGIKLDNLEIRNMLTAGVWTYNNNHTITNCVIHTIGPQPKQQDPGSAGYGNGVFSQSTTNLIISDCIISNCNYNGIYLSPANDSIIIHNNEICDINMDAIGYGGSTYFLISSNRIHDVKNAVTHGDGMQLLSQHTNQPLVICNNTVWNCSQQIFVEPYCSPLASIKYGESWVFNNVAYNPNPGTNGIQGYSNGIILDNYALIKGIYVFNNTMVDLNSGSGGLRLQQRDASCQITNAWNLNNLFYNSYSTQFTPTNGVTNLRSGHNLYTNQWRDQFSFNPRKLWPDWETNSVIGPVSFQDYANRNYKPLTGPSIGGGTNLSTLVSSDTFKSIPEAFRPDPTKDRNGILRRTKWDIGAFESDSVITNPIPIPIPPPKPDKYTNLTVTTWITNILKIDQNISLDPSNPTQYYSVTFTNYYSNTNK